MLTKIYSAIILRLSLIIRTRWMRQLIPPECLVEPLEATNREKYTAERKVYRLTKDLQSDNYPLTKWEYYIYKAIAEKYGWPYIKEVYDD